MKTLTILALLLSLVSCGKQGGGGDSDPIGASSGFNVVLLDAGNNVVNSVTFPTPLNPTYDTRIELDFTLKNIGTDAGDIIYVSDGPDFEVTTLDPRCNGSGVLQPGESCAIKVVFKYIIQPDGAYSANLMGWADGGNYKPYIVNGTITTSL